MLFKLGKNLQVGDFPSGPVVKNPSCNAGDIGSVPGKGTNIPHVVSNYRDCAQGSAHHH